MTQNHFAKANVFDRMRGSVKGILRYFPVWKDLLFLSLVIIAYLGATLIVPVFSRYAQTNVEYTNQALVKTIWSPSAGEVDHYRLSIRDTIFSPGGKNKGGITMIKQDTSPVPEYVLTCEHNHSYVVSVAAVSPTGVVSPFSRESNLLICDQQPPLIELEPLPSPAKLRYAWVTIRGRFIEPNLRFITLNGKLATIDGAQGMFIAHAQLYPGRNRLTLLAVDYAENTTTKTLELEYAPLTIVSLPTAARIYWNGNYSYLGIYSGDTPQSFNQTVPGKQVLRLTYPGFNDYYRLIDFAELTTDLYAITLTPFRGIQFSQARQLVMNDQPLAIGQCTYPLVIDYDLDGNKDLLVGTKDGTITLFINRGADDHPRFKDSSLLRAGNEVLCVGSHAAPCAVDYNNDGRQDMLVGTGEGYLTLFLNRGDNFAPVYGTAAVLNDASGNEIRVSGYCVPQPIDWNGDNRKDLLLGSGDGTLYLLLNQGTDGNPEFAAAQPVTADGAPIDVGNFAAPFAADWNGDGKTDLLVGDGDGYIHLYLDLSTSSTPQLIAAGLVTVNGERLSLDGAAAPFLIDWDNDGRKDLLVGCRDGSVYLFTD